jgi:tetratricopeptide (TPR) repeat protein
VAAERQLELAIGQDPESARAHSLLARTLAEQGRAEEAAPHAATARALAPPPPPPPDVPLDVDSKGLVFLLLPPEPPRHAALGVPGEWQDPRVPRQLVARIHARLPDAAVTETTPATVKAAEEWLRAQSPRAVISLRVDQADCGESVKDGPFALVSFTVAAARSGALPDPPAHVRVADDDPGLGEACADLALSRALEEALVLPGVDAALRAPAAPAEGAWHALAVRTLFPILDQRVAQEIQRGREERTLGEPQSAEQSLRRGEAVDPKQASDYASLVEAERAKEPAEDAARRAADLPRDAESEALEAEIAAERSRRDELLAALRVDELAQRAPTREEIAVLRVKAISEPQALGPRLARERAGGRNVELRVLYGPDAAPLARFYFEPGAPTPLLREDDKDLDGLPDRWTAYAHEKASEIFEDRGNSGRVNAHIQLAADGVSTEIIEIDLDGNGKPERVFHYDRGVLLAGDEDVNGDGVLDRFERFDPDGSTASRDEDLDGDGRVDVRSEFTGGKLVRREILNPALLEALSTRP